MIARPWIATLPVAIVLIMYAASKRNSRWLSRESHGRFVAFLLIIVALIALVLNYTNVFKFSVFRTWDPNARNPALSLAVTPATADFDKEFYGIMFDAGSTGTRIHVFKFKHVAPGLPFELVDELFREVKPGLSAYADSPKQAAQSVGRLLDDAKKYIPEQKWTSTPLALKATAGLRLLPAEKADAIIREVTTLQNSYPFKSGADSVQIMGGNEEGIFSFITLNYLKKTMSNIDHIHGVMDLGGGSTQITFVPSEKSTIDSAPEDFLKDIDVFGTNYRLYTHSYLGLGLMSGRLQTLGGKQAVPGDQGQALSSPCVARQARIHWLQGGVNYTIYGMDVKESRFDACYRAAARVVKDVQKPSEIKTKQFSIISYYFDRAVDAKLIDKEFGGEVSVEDYFRAADTACNNLNPTKEMEFLCLDLAYISALLHEGFGFPKDTKVHVQKRISGREVSWALGAMFNYFL